MMVGVGQSSVKFELGCPIRKSSCSNSSSVSFSPCPNSRHSCQSSLKPMAWPSQFFYFVVELYILRHVENTVKSQSNRGLQILPVLRDFLKSNITAFPLISLNFDAHSWLVPMLDAQTVILPMCHQRIEKTTMVVREPTQGWPFLGGRRLTNTYRDLWETSHLSAKLEMWLANTKKWTPPSSASHQLGCILPVWQPKKNGEAAKLYFHT